jgi:uncharacterized protein (TIGR02300 family)
VAKIELGAKRQCQNCGAKFFDLNKDPIVCPKCGTIFQGAARVERAAAKAEVEEDEVVAPAGVELVSLDEVEASEEKAAEPAAEDVDVEEGEAEPDDPFIEAEEEDEDDVTNLIDGDIAPDEEP